MTEKPVRIPFNKDYMTAKDLKFCAAALQSVLHSFDQFKDDPEEFATRVLQLRGRFTID